MKKLLAGTAMAAAMFTSTIASAAVLEPTVVLVHGAFADGSSWQKVIPLLRGRGLHVVAVQNPLSSLADDVAATRRAIEAAHGPVVLVGHSWGGVVITQAGNDPKVKSLVYVAAFAPDDGQSIANMTTGGPSPAYAPFLRKDSGGYLTLSLKGVKTDFAQDLPPAETELVAITQGPWAAGCVEDKVTHAAWHDKPAWDVVTENDRMIPPKLQKTMAAAMHANVFKIASSHVAMLSHPKAVANAIIAAAAAASR